MDEKVSVIQDMKKLGFSEYECKAYLSLLEEYPLNGYALSKASGIPRSRIYEVLQSLKDKNLVQEQIQEKNKIYFPIDPEIFIKHSKQTLEESISKVGKFADRLYKKKNRDNRLVVIKGRKNIVDFLKQLIENADTRIAISMWEEELTELYPEIEGAVKRGVILRGIYFGDKNRFDTLVPHRRIERYMAEKKERFMTIIVDRRDVISGIVSRGENSQVTWTQDEGFIEISEDYIAHDLIVNLQSASLKGRARQNFEDFADSISKDYFNYSDEEFKQFIK